MKHLFAVKSLDQIKLDSEAPGAPKRRSSQLTPKSVIAAASTSTERAAPTMPCRPRPVEIVERV